MMLIFLFLRLHRPQNINNTELGDWGYQRINARCKWNRISGRKAWFSKYVSTTFVAHCSLQLRLMHWEYFQMQMTLISFSWYSPAASINQIKNKLKYVFRCTNIAGVEQRRGAQFYQWKCWWLGAGFILEVRAKLQRLCLLSITFLCYSCTELKFPFFFLTFYLGHLVA